MTDTAARKPFHLVGNYAPIDTEVTATDLNVTGQIPAELNGRYFRNGANPITGESDHWFLGDGMIHGIELAGGTASWYRNRYVRTPFFDKPEMPVIDLQNPVYDLGNSKANTHVIRHGGRILALEEGHLPYELTTDLDTVGTWDYDGKLNTAMTAHPKVCPETGELLFFGYSLMGQPYVTYHRADAEGRLVHSASIETGGPTMMHDFNVTRNFVIFMDLPAVFDLGAAMRGEMPIRWSETYPARLGVLPREHGSNADVEWYEIDPCYVFHPMNAYEDGNGDLVLDVARYAHMWRDSSWDVPSSLLTRWTINRAAGKVHEEQLDDRSAEFARVADGVVGRRHRYGYMVTGEADAGIVKYDLHDGASCVTHSLGPGRAAGEAVFVAREGAGAEDDGWLMTYVYDRSRDSSDFVILDASDLSAGPVATVELPQRVPFGFHGSWIADL